MKRLLLLCMLLLTACAAPVPRPAEPPAIREVSGVAAGETLLSGQVLLAGDLLVPAGSRLTIAAGTTVTVRPVNATKIDPEFLSSQTELLVRGSLRIEGTEAQPVTFAVETVDGEAQWAGILLDRASDSLLRHVRVASADSGVLLVDTDARLEQLDIRNCRYGIIVQSGSPVIRATTVADGEGGVYVWDHAEPKLDGVAIHDNAEEGLMVARACRPQLNAVTIFGNDIGVVIPAGFDLGGLQVHDNRVDRLLLAKQGE